MTNIERARAFLVAKNDWSDGFIEDAAPLMADFADSEQQWIPAATPPEEDGEYLVTVEIDIEGELVRKVAVKEFDRQIGWLLAYKNTITAWQPLPPPATTK